MLTTELPAYITATVRLNIPATVLDMSISNSRNVINIDSKRSSNTTGDVCNLLHMKCCGIKEKPLLDNEDEQPCLSLDTSMNFKLDIVLFHPH